MMSMQPVRRGTQPLLIGLIAALGVVGCSDSDNDTVNNDPAANPVTAAQHCANLADLTIAEASIGMPTTGARVTATTLQAASGAAPVAVGEYCAVKGEIDPVDPVAPVIKFQVNLPTDWNRKAMMFGGGGYNGSVAAGTGNVPAGPTDQPSPLGRGYVTFGSDSGHQANADGSRDGSFGSNDEALKNFASDALKKTRDVAMAIISARYEATPEKTYFAGGSTGGREALLAVQNWPEDFDGAIVLYPAWNGASLDLQFGRVTRALAEPGAYPSRAKRKVLYDAAMAACDELDGAADGLISNQNECDAVFDPATAMLDGSPVRCESGADTGDACLSDAQITAFKVINTPLTLNYALASGETSYPGFTTWGTDFGIPGDGPLRPTTLTLSLGTEQPAYPFPPVTAAAMPPYGSTFWDQWVKYFVTRDPAYNSLTLDPENPGAWQARIVELTTLQDANATDLSAFQNRGGKILMAHGIHDALVSNRATRQYLGRLNTAMGAEKVQSFLRYYEIAGYGHAVSSDFNAGWDSLTALENWVERGTEPTAQVVADNIGVPGRTRPLCEYPSWPRYDGTGDINAAQSFSCATN